MKTYRNVVMFTLLAGGFLLPARGWAAEVVIENDSDHEFYYSLRLQSGQPWSTSFELAPHSRRAHPAATRLQISYLSDRARFAWLAAGRTYRITDVLQDRLRPVTEARRPVVPSSGDEPSPDETEPPADADPLAFPFDSPDAPAAESQPGRPAPAGESSLLVDPPIADPFEGLFDVDHRHVNVIAIADQAYRDNIDDWRDRMMNVVAGASAYYQREFGIRLIVKQVDPWNYSALEDTREERWQRLLQQSPGAADLVIAFVGFGDFQQAQPGTVYTGELGRAAFFGQHVMISDQADLHENRAKTVLIHELGHVFGAFHVNNAQWVMYPGYYELPTQDIISGRIPFGDQPSEVLRLTRGFDFQRGVGSLAPRVRGQLQALYRAYGLPAEQAQGDPVTQGFRYLEQRAQMRAAEMARQAEQARAAFDALAN